MSNTVCISFPFCKSKTFLLLFTCELNSQFKFLHVKFKNLKMPSTHIQLLMDKKFFRQCKTLQFITNKEKTAILDNIYIVDYVKRWNLRFCLLKTNAYIWQLFLKIVLCKEVHISWFRIPNLNWCFDSLNVNYFPVCSWSINLYHLWAKNPLLKSNWRKINGGGKQEKQEKQEKGFLHNHHFRY